MGCRVGGASQALARPAGEGHRFVARRMSQVLMFHVKQNFPCPASHAFHRRTPAMIRTHLTTQCPMPSAQCPPSAQNERIPRSARGALTAGSVATERVRLCLFLQARPWPQHFACPAAPPIGKQRSPAVFDVSRETHGTAPPQLGPLGRAAGCEGAGNVPAMPAGHAESRPPRRKMGATTGPGSTETGHCGFRTCISWQCSRTPRGFARP